MEVARGERLERMGLEIVEHEPKERLEGADGGEELRARVEHRSEFRRCAPATRIVAEHDRDHDGQLGARVLALPRVPDANQVLQEAQRHPRIERGLMLEEHVNERLAATADLHAIQQIGVRVPELIVDEGAGADRQRREVQLRPDRRGQDKLELAAREIGLTKGGLEEGVVGRSRRRHAVAASRMVTFSISGQLGECRGAMKDDDRCSRASPSNLGSSRPFPCRAGMDRSGACTPQTTFTTTSSSGSSTRAKTAFEFTGLTECRTLFGELCLRIVWGRIGNRRLRERSETFLIARRWCVAVASCSIVVSGTATCRPRRRGPRPAPAPNNVPRSSQSTPPSERSLRAMGYLSRTRPRERSSLAGTTRRRPSSAISELEAPK